MNSIDNKLLLKRFKQSKLNYVNLVNDTSISKSTICNIMSGRTSPSHYATVRLAEALNLTQEEIIAIFFPNIKFNEGCSDD